MTRDHLNEQGSKEQDPDRGTLMLLYIQIDDAGNRATCM